MKLRTRLYLVLTALTALFVAVLVADEVRETRASIREEIEAANRVAAHLLGRLGPVYAAAAGPEAVQELLRQLGHVRSNEITLRGPSGEVLYQSPPPVYKAGREAPAWFTRLLAPEPARQMFELTPGTQLIIEAQPSRAILDAWDDLKRLVAFAVAMLLLIGAGVFFLVGRALAPFPVIIGALERLKAGELSYRLPVLRGVEAGAIGAAFNAMAQAMQDKVQVEREAREAHTRLEERRELALLIEQSVEEERRLISHELHDEFGQSVTAIRSLAMAIAAQNPADAVSEPARLICAEAARLYDAMHGLIPRLAPPSLDTLGLAESLEALVRESQRRHPALRLSLHHELPPDLGASATLAAYRVVQEGLVNALRHARAAHVAIEVRRDATGMQVAVNDDGVGLPEEWSRPGHFGLRGLSERLGQLGGRLEVRNREPHGVALTAHIPLVAGA